MRKTKFNKEDVKSFLINRKIGTIKELKNIVGTDVNMTVFRILKNLLYRSSYSHGGRFYTLDEIANFDENGLWSYQTVCFSQYGSLLATMEHLITHSTAGYFASDLERLLHVGVRESLLRLIKKGKIHRIKKSGAYLYCSSEPAMRKQQILSRQVDPSENFSDEVKAAIIIFVSLLNEQQLRLFAGLEALKLGRGGDLQIAQLLGLHRQTVAKGRMDLMERDVVIERSRKSGGGRKLVEKKRQT